VDVGLQTNAKRNCSDALTKKKTEQALTFPSDKPIKRMIHFLPEEHWTQSKQVMDVKTLARPPAVLLKLELVKTAAKGETFN